MQGRRNAFKNILFFYRPVASLSRGTEIAETGIFVSGLCVSSEAGGKYAREKMF